MINIGTEKTVDKKAMIKRITSLIVFALIFIVGWFLFINLYFNNNQMFQSSVQPNYQNQEELKMQDLIDFVSSDSFKDLVFTPDPSLFNEPTGSFNSGKSNPFAEN